jgi:DNA-binding response OmpR family regulator
VVTDVAMPRLGGIALARALRAEATDLPILFVSGHTESDPRAELPPPERTAFLAKPFAPTTLRRQVEALLA